MIVVKLELWPSGDSKRAVDLGKAVIANLGGGAISRYEVKLLKGARYSKKPGDVYKSGVVPAFPREDRRFGPWELLALALDVTVGDRIERLKKYLGSLAELPGLTDGVEKE